MIHLPRLPYWLRFSLAVVKTFFISHFFLTHVGWPALTYGPSMLPTISVRGVTVYTDHRFAQGRGIKVGDVVEFDRPMQRGTRAVKRVMGMPGDFVVKDNEGEEGKSGKMMIQVWRSILTEKRRLGMGNSQAWAGETGLNEAFSNEQVPEGHCWLLGDNLPESRDSRLYGPIPLALVKGKVIAKVLPFSERGWIKNGLQRPEDP